MNKTVILVRQWNISYSDHWNVPTSILKKEILPAIEKLNYLAEHNMEWKDSFVRQRPGPENSD
jgi:murein L,D-transpeptidase YcbB/YkuD